MYVGGRFTSIGGQTRNGLAALDASSGAATDWNPNVPTSSPINPVDAVAVTGSALFAGGLVAAHRSQSPPKA